MGMNWKRYSITVNPDVWEQAKELVTDELNMSMSKFIEIQLRTLVRSHNAPMAQVMSGVMQDFISGSKSLSEGERRKMQSLFDKEKKKKKK